ncbi:unnamed protein product [Effrenium voratum]|nr:unnamed protein product [Effrenium voratum]
MAALALLAAASIPSAAAKSARAPAFAEAALWAARQVPEACNGPDDACEGAWLAVAQAWRYSWNNLRLALEHASSAHRLRLDPREVRQIVALHEFMYWLGQDSEKWRLGWEEVSGTARSLLRALQLWLVPSEYQWGTRLEVSGASHGLRLPFPARSVVVPTSGDLSSALRLSNGQEMPLLSFRPGPVWEIPVKATALYEQLRHALKLGYRHIDLPEFFGAEKELGRALKDSEVPREQLFLSGKLSSKDCYPMGALRAVQQQLKHLEVEYLDLLVVKPCPEPAQSAVWEVLEAFHAKGALRSLGLADLDVTGAGAVVLPGVHVAPVYVQTRFSPYTDASVLAWALPKGLAVAANRVTGTFGTSFLRPEEDPHLLQVAKSVGRSSSEVLGRWALQLGLALVVDHAEAYVGVFDFQLAEEDMRVISGLARLSFSAPGLRVDSAELTEDVYGLERFEAKGAASLDGRMDHPH